MTSMHVKEGEMSRGVLMQRGDRESIGLWNGQSGGEAVGYKPPLPAGGPGGEY